ncbi:MAG TPA: hypothetical protein VGK40_08805 [Verrucomicrobiae bacterium]|jgi:hypothetical protein
MARKVRVEYAGAIYHVMNRGDRREPIFKDEAYHRRFLATLDENCSSRFNERHKLFGHCCPFPLL